ncbi:septum formation family protein [Nocardioides sp. 503]|uniref:septum formation family protein n=1 Tax=Nocardioides sp. 503 TaxID=2508326 RepID=UPI0010703033|nr:septum formation family protein [Nocardioides sp. 503]
MLRSALRSLLVTVAAAAILAGPSLADAAPAQRAGDPTFHLQPVGSCHALTYKQYFAASAPATAVPCTDPHTSQTIATVRLTGKVDWKDSGALWPKIAKRCYPAMKSALGTNPKTRAMSSYAAAWFIPSAAERRQGAKWLRCDLILRGGKQLQPLPTDGSPLLTAPLSDAVAHCITHRFADTVCTKAHAYRVAGVARIAGKRYPGDKRLAKMATRKCPGITGTARNWRWSSPSADTWKYADRMLVCYDKTRR